VYWTETRGGQLLSGPKLAKSFSVYQEEEEKRRRRMSTERHVSAYSEAIIMFYDC